MAEIDNDIEFNKEDVIFITAETGYVKTGLEKGRYKVFHPYIYKTVVGRVFLEVFNRLKLPQRVFFNKKIFGTPCKYIIVLDSIVTRQFLKWLISQVNDKKIIFVYTNMVGKAHHLIPNEIPKEIEIWTYDKHDSDKYGINHCTSGGYFTSFIGEEREKKYDVMYVGKDKGRAEYILDLKSKFEDIGLTTKFLIMPSTRVSKKKDFYSKPIPYEDVVKLVTESRAILNIALPEQQGVTMRDYESIYNGVKLITTNSYIRSCDFYKKENVFVLGEDEDRDLLEFVRSSFLNIDEGILKKYSIDSFVNEIIDRR